MRGFRTGYNLLLATLLPVAVISCSYKLDVSSDGTDALCISAFPVAGDNISFVEFSVARPVGSERRVLSPGELDFHVTVNGEECKAGLYSSGRQADTYYFDRAIADGDIVEMTARSASFGTITTSSAVPAAPEFRLDRPAGQVIFPPYPDNRKRYYGLRAYCRMLREDVDWGRTGERQYSVEERIDTLLPEGTSPVTIPDMDLHNIKTIASIDIGGEPMLVFEDYGNGLDSLIINISGLTLPENRIIFNTYVRDTLTISWFSKVEVFSLSEIAYKYLNPQINRSLLGFGLIPPFAGTGNVEGGFGIFSCLGYADSGWIPQTVVAP